MKRTILLAQLTLFLTCLCHVRAQGQTELALPVVPQTLTVPADRAAYVAEHFWDAMDWKDTTLVRDRGFMEQSFANFLSIFPLLSPQVSAVAVNTLMQKAAGDVEAYRTVADIAGKYLFDPNSPMLNEELYMLFLGDMTKSELLDNTERMRYREEQIVVGKNRRGSVASDFEYVDRNGRRRTLHTTDAERMLLMFYDPDCEHCKETLDALKNNAALHDAVVSGRVTVLAVYADGNRSLWDKTKDSLPGEWLVGYDLSALQQRGAYILRAMPTIFVLDKGKKVLEKDFMPENLPLLLGGGQR